MRHILTVDKMSYHKSFSVILYKLCRYTMYRHERYNKGNKMNTVKRIANIVAFIIVAETILFTIFGIIPELLKASL